ncbi:uncharacterized protein MEPE_06451 [Melanopsichium pennsylvanicum]|uniref:Uncharacterized protein n=1 Tax=Melanopsichium pennsylvanicum TaxID=63383 RepID=A0AAJ4XTK5_9BASI|nr:uncharacterized protein MEPE_06451 [Melanopsichium pennsylvanicum]
MVQICGMRRKGGLRGIWMMEPRRVGSIVWTWHILGLINSNIDVGSVYGYVWRSWTRSSISYRTWNRRKTNRDRAMVKKRIEKKDNLKCEHRHESVLENNSDHRIVNCKDTIKRKEKREPVRDDDDDDDDDDGRVE